ncbi:MAG: adenylate cyclase [Pseudonocardiales bacterium]|nr:adenylate cyclase [Pseudonocardiales bacterium]
MDRIWQWAWDRHGARYSWAVCAVTYLASVPIYLLPTAVVVAFEGSSHYLEAAALTIISLLAMMYVVALPGWGAGRVVERWAAGEEVDRASALAATYAWSRGVVARVLAGVVVGRHALCRCWRDGRGARVAAGPVRDAGRHLRCSPPDR